MTTTGTLFFLYLVNALCRSYAGYVDEICFWWTTTSVLSKLWGKWANSCTFRSAPTLSKENVKLRILRNIFHFLELVHNSYHQSVISFQSTEGSFGFLPNRNFFVVNVLQIFWLLSFMLIINTFEIPNKSKELTRIRIECEARIGRSPPQSSTARSLTSQDPSSTISTIASQLPTQKQGEAEPETSSTQSKRAVETSSVPTATITAAGSTRGNISASVTAQQDLRNSIDPIESSSQLALKRKEKSLDAFPLSEENRTKTLP